MPNYTTVVKFTDLMDREVEQTWAVSGVKSAKDAREQVSALLTPFAQVKPADPGDLSSGRGIVFSDTRETPRVSCVSSTVGKLRTK